MIDFVSLGGSQSTCATNVGLLASRCGSASVASSSVASPIVTGSFLASSSVASSSVASLSMAGALFLAASVISICGLVVGVIGLLVFNSFLLSTRSLIVVWSSLLCGVAYVSKLVRQKWKHCTFPECQARASREESWPPIHVLIACFKKNVRLNHELIRSGKSQARYLAAAVSHNSLLRASAALVRRKPTLFPCDQPTDKDHRQVRRHYFTSACVCVHKNLLCSKLYVSCLVYAVLP